MLGLRCRSKGVVVLLLLRQHWAALAVALLPCGCCGEAREQLRVCCWNPLAGLCVLLIIGVVVASVGWLVRCMGLDSSTALPARCMQRMQSADEGRCYPC